MLPEWTIRIVLPRRFQKAKALYRWAVRDDLARPPSYAVSKDLEWHFRTRHGRDLRYVTAPDLTVQDAAKTFSAARLRALA